MNTPSFPLSLLDFCTIYSDETPGESMKRSVELAQTAEDYGFTRIWYSEHHNMKTISSSAPAVLIAHVGAHTNTIRLGAGGVMLPNHAPYIIAEQFGTLAELYPGRIDLGLGRAPGTDPNTLGRALRRDSHAAEQFPEDVKELQGYLSNSSPIPGVQAVPGAGTNVPLYILGSSMFGASLAAKFGLPYSFASHFAPTHLEAATSYYRQHFVPSEKHEKPYVIAGVNVLGAHSEEEAAQRWEGVCRQRVRAMAGRGKFLTDSQVDQILASHQGQQIIGMMRYAAVGTAPHIQSYLEDFKKLSQADEIIVSLLGRNHAETLESLDTLASIWR